MGGRRAVSGLVLAAVLLTGCDRFLGGARNAYDEGWYRDSEEILRAHEHAFSHLPMHRRAEFALLRGLTLLMLDNPDGARQWLWIAEAIEREEPGCLDAAQRFELQRGRALLAALEARRHGNRGAPPVQPSVALPAAAAPAAAPPKRD